MKRWMIAVCVVQAFCFLIVLLQILGLWPESLWATAWLLGLPGSEIGQAFAEHLLWRKVSGWPVGMLGALFMVVINVLLAFALGALTRFVYRAARRRPSSQESENSRF
ncbi:hypothetical protein [Luteibacter sp.]|uniref:hypothetical protein n=1 Tax=Luteibacter sp. TaxID=1886636 RepID=UPI003F805C70